MPMITLNGIDMDVSAVTVVEAVKLPDDPTNNVYNTFEITIQGVVAPKDPNVASDPSLGSI
jgi:hypothetical protein